MLQVCCNLRIFSRLCKLEMWQLTWKWSVAHNGDTTWCLKPFFLTSAQFTVANVSWCGVSWQLPEVSNPVRSSLPGPTEAYFNSLHSTEHRHLGWTCGLNLGHCRGPWQTCDFEQTCRGVSWVRHHFQSDTWSSSLPVKLFQTMSALEPPLFYSCVAGRRECAPL